LAITIRRGNTGTLVRLLGFASLWASVLLVLIEAHSACQARGSVGHAPNTGGSLAVVLHPYFDNGRWGFVDSSGRSVIAPQFTWARDFFEDRAAVRSVDPVKCGYITPTGSWAVILPNGAMPWTRFAQGRAWFLDAAEQRIGCVDSGGKVLVPPKFGKVEDFSEDLAVVSDERARGGGNRLVDRSERAVARYGFIDRSGRVALPMAYRQAKSFGNGLAPILRENTFEYIDRAGQVVISPARLSSNPTSFISKASVFSDGLATVSFSGGNSAKPFVLFVDSSGRVVGPSFEDAGTFSEGLAWAKFDGMVGYVDTTAKRVIPARFDQGGDFHEGRCRVVRGGVWAYIDRRGAVVAKGGRGADEGWNDAEDFHRGLARVHLGGKLMQPDDGGTWWSRGRWLYIDLRGQIVCVCRVDSEKPISPPLGRENKF
jgi:WG containing repeat